MPGPAIVSNGAALAAGLRSEFDGMYRQSYDNVLRSIGDAMRMGLPSDKLTELYAYRETAPYPERWEKGDGIPTEGMESVQFQVTNYEYAKRIPWHANDRADNQVGDLYTDAQQAGAHFASIPSIVLVELMTGTPGLLPAIPNAPDGAAPYSGTDGSGSARFGVTGGNIEAASAAAPATPTAAEVTTSWFATMNRFGQFLNTKGHFFFEPDVTEASYLVYFPVEQTEVFTEAFKAISIFASDTNGAAAPSNVILASGVQVELRPTGRLTGSTYYTFHRGSWMQPFFQQLREPLQFAQATMENSDQVRTTKEEYVQWSRREGYGVAVPFGTIQTTFS